MDQDDYDDLREKLEAVEEGKADYSVGANTLFVTFDNGIEIAVPMRDLQRYAERTTVR